MHAETDSPVAPHDEPVRLLVAADERQVLWGIRYVPSTRFAQHLDFLSGDFSPWAGQKVRQITGKEISNSGSFPNVGTFFPNR